MRKFMSILLGKEDPSNQEKISLMNDIGAKANARVNMIVRDPNDIDHISKKYPKQPVIMNGVTKGIEVMEVFSDNYCQVLSVKFAPMGFSPCHTHPHYSVCHVVSGEIYDSVRGLKFKENNWYVNLPGEQHSSQSVSGAILRVYNTKSKTLSDIILKEKKYTSLDCK